LAERKSSPWPFWVFSDILRQHVPYKKREGEAQGLSVRTADYFGSWLVGCFWYQFSLQVPPLSDVLLKLLL
jgi:hypothetical protein